MSILRKEVHDRNFTIIENSTIRDPRLSFKATGILCYLLSKPDGWQVNNRELAQNKKDGREAVMSGLRELEELGYLERFKERQADGTFVNVSVVREIPTVRQDAGNPTAPGSGNPTSDEPGSDSPTSENSATIEEKKYEVPIEEETSKEEPSSLVLANEGTKTKVQIRQESAAAILNEWWEQQEPRPAQPWIACRKVVEKFLVAKRTPEEIRWMLDNAPVISTGAMTLAWNTRPGAKAARRDDRLRESAERFLADVDARELEESTF